MMKTTNWKDIAELVGIAAIVASLIFVGVQLKQDRSIAQGAAFASAADKLVDSYLGWNEYADVLVRGNAGEELSDAEEWVIQNLTEMHYDFYLLSVLQAQSIGGQTTTAELRLASFLYKNPAARKAWMRRVEELENNVDALLPADSELRNPGQDADAELRKRVMGYLAVLDERQK